ncbi:MAG TPA: hypothetical protein VH025_00770 [Solirubrobacteraceae bacterium]|jgi:hypothetical protein|nr:hypothetical protein [Solirubrobacteraceae bacterium]
MEDAELRVRSLGQFRLVAVLGALSTLAMLLIAVWTGSGAAHVFAVIAALAFAGLTIRGVRAGVYVERESVVIRGMLLTRRVPSAAIERFSYEPLKRLPAMGVARLRDGRRLPITAIGAGHVPTERVVGEGEALIAELNELLSCEPAEVRVFGPPRADLERTLERS